MFHVNRQGAVYVLSGTDPLSAEHVESARAVSEQCYGKGQPQIVINLAGVPLIDSAGLEFLLDLRDRAVRSGGAVQLAEPKALCRDILQATGLAGQFAIFDQLNAAVGSFAQ
ncbi:MAG: STAS domain-containing protein [Aureliella sp.]